MARNSCGTCSLVTATVLGPIVIVLLAVSFATDHWLDFDVNRNQIDSTRRTASNTNRTLARYTHTRNRGFFRECYPENDTLFLEATGPNDDEVIDKHCFNVRYGIPPEKGNEDWDSDFMARIHLMRCWLAFFILALVIFLTAYIFGLVLCCWRQSRWAYIAGLCAYIGAFSTAAAIAFFHGAEYLERNKITQCDPYQGCFYLGWTPDVKNATDREYGYSYIIGWVAMVLAALTATFYSVAGCYIGKERYEDREYLEKSKYVDRGGYPMALEPPYPEQYYGYPRPYQGQAYPGPYVYDMDNRQPLPALTYGPESMPTSQWRWA